MVLLEQGQYFKAIKEELDSISIIKSGSATNLPVIENIEAFSKTQVYQSLRKGQLSDEELSFIITNYNYGISELNQLILSKIKDLTITKAISIGAISKILEDRNVSSFYDRSNFEYELKAFIEIKDYELELIDFIKFFNHRKTLKINENCDKEVFELFLKSFWYDGLVDYSTEDLIEREAAKKAIKNHYKDIYELLQEPLRVKSKNKHNFNTVFTFSNAPFSFSSQKEGGAEELEKRTQKEESREKINRIIETMSHCPYADMDFIFDLINEDKHLESSDKIYLLITCAVSSYVPSLIDFNECLSKIEILHKMWGVKESLADLTLKSMSSNSSRLSFVLRNLKHCEKLTKERKREIYSIYFTSQKAHNIYGYNGFKMDLLVKLQLDDKDVADFLRNCVPKRVNMSDLRRAYSCTPGDRNSYPGLETLLEIAKRELEKYYIPNIEMVLQDSEKTDKNLILENYFFNPSVMTFDDMLITWRMANDPKFMRKIIFTYSGRNNFKVNKTIAKMNLKSIGFKKYITYLEDYARQYKSNTLSAVSKNALKYATQSQLYMYKRIIPEETLCSSPFINFKLLNYFLSRFEARKEGYGYDETLKRMFAVGIERNRTLSKEEFISIITRLAKSKAGSSRLFSTDKILNSRTSILYIKTALDTKLTVKDFSDYYDSLEGVK